MKTVYDTPLKINGTKFYMYDLLTTEEEQALVKFIEDNNLTVIGENNSKIVNTGKVYGYKTASVDLLAGHTCPAASLCHSAVIKEKDGSKHIEDYGEFRCYATKSEVSYSAVYNLHESNYNTSKLASFPLILTYLLRKAGKTLVRIHSSGDMYDFDYFRKWIRIAQYNPHITFFTYTKQATFYAFYLKDPLKNLKIIYSMGGKLDAYALKHNLPSCTVVTDDYLYHDSNTTIVELPDGNYEYTYTIKRKYGKNIKTTIVKHTSDMYLEYGTFYNKIKGCVENLSCMHDSQRSSVDDFERIMRQESFGIIFH